MKTVAAIFLLLVALNALAQNPVVPTNSASITLAWEASPSLGVVGYRIYFFAANGPTNWANVGNTTTARLTGITFPMSFYATAYDASGAESLPSNLLRNVHWETDETIYGQTATNVTGPFTNNFLVATRTNATGSELFRLFIVRSNRLATTP